MRTRQESANAEGEELEFTTVTPHMSDWAHVSFHYVQGRLLPKSNPYYGPVYHYLKALHFCHSTEMKDFVQELLTAVMEEWESNGEQQHGRYTTASLRREHMTAPWDTFSIGAHDGMLKNYNDLQVTHTFARIHVHYGA